MEEGGWVERRPDPNDRRARLLYMTGKARPVIEELRALAEELYAEALAGLSADARTQLIGLLTQLRHNLVEPQAEPRAVAAGSRA
jgi:MarR family transcriptional regulator for hemolysin